MGVSHFDGMFPNKNHPAMGVPPFMETPWNWMSHLQRTKISLEIYVQFQGAKEPHILSDFWMVSCFLTNLLGTSIDFLGTNLSRFHDGMPGCQLYHTFCWDSAENPRIVALSDPVVLCCACHLHIKLVEIWRPHGLIWPVWQSGDMWGSMPRFGDIYIYIYVIG